MQWYWMNHVNEGLLCRIIDEGHANALTDVQIETAAPDPFLIAYAKTC